MEYTLNKALFIIFPNLTCAFRKTRVYLVNHLKNRIIFDTRYKELCLYFISSSV